MSDFLDFLRSLPISVLIAASIVILLLVSGLVLSFRRPPANLDAFSNEAGTVLVSRKALQQLVRQACLKDPLVEAAKPLVRIRGKKVDTKVIVRLASPDDLKETTDRLQSTIKWLLQKSLNFDEIGKIRIIVSGFARSEEERCVEPQSTSLPEKESSDLTPPSQSKPTDNKGARQA